MLHSGDFRFSFSGLKTAVRYLLDRESVSLPDVCASFQSAVLDVLVEKTVTAALESGRKVVALSGGVSSNRRLQEMMQTRADQVGLTVQLAPRELRTDNAAMIAYVAALRFARTEAVSQLNADVSPAIDLATFGRMAA